MIKKINRNLLNVQHVEKLRFLPLHKIIECILKLNGILKMLKESQKGYQYSQNNSIRFKFLIKIINE